MKDLSNPPSRNEVVVITGGASGIGYQCAVQAAARGANVAILDMNHSAAENAIQKLQGGPHLALEANVTDPNSMKQTIDHVANRLGAISGVVAAVGVVNREPLREISAASFRELFAINVEGIQNTIVAAIPHLEKSKFPPAIVILGSAAADNGGGLMGSGAYAATKSAVIGLARGYARELAPLNIRTNVVSPSATDTPMTRELSPEERAAMTSKVLLNRFLNPEEIASTINFLLSPGAGAITGQTIRPNAGAYFA